MLKRLAFLSGDPPRKHRSQECSRRVDQRMRSDRSTGWMLANRPQHRIPLIQDITRRETHCPAKS